MSSPCRITNFRLDRRSRNALDRTADRHVSCCAGSDVGFQLDSEFVISTLPPLLFIDDVRLTWDSIVDAFFPYSAAAVAGATAVRVLRLVRGDGTDPA